MAGVATGGDVVEGARIGQAQRSSYGCKIPTKTDKSRPDPFLEAAQLIEEQFLYLSLTDYLDFPQKEPGAYTNKVLGRVSVEELDRYGNTLTRSQRTNTGKEKAAIEVDAVDNT